VQYGDGAVGGVINIVTRNGVAVPNQARIEGGIGSFATRVENISASGSSGPFSAFVIGNNFNTDGYRDNNEFEERSAVGDFRWTFAKGSVYFNIAGDGQRLGLPGARTVDLGAGINQVRDDRRGTSTPFDYADQQGVRGYSLAWRCSVGWPRASVLPISMSVLALLYLVYQQISTFVRRSRMTGKPVCD
jgi:iron complex outermembrane recepter protein